MQKKSSFFLSLLFFLPFFSKEENFIDWSSKRKLTWDDFKAVPIQNSDAAAMTATHLGFSYNFSNNKVQYEIDCRFDKTKSWGLVKTDWILAHEQGHFDIAEIFTRKLHKLVSAYSFNNKTFQKDLSAIYESIVREKEEFQKAYDIETNHSRNRPKQDEWLKKISAMLKEFEAFSNY